MGLCFMFELVLLNFGIVLGIGVFMFGFGLRFSSANTVCVVDCV